LFFSIFSSLAFSFDWIASSLLFIANELTEYSILNVIWHWHYQVHGNSQALSALKILSYQWLSYQSSPLSPSPMNSKRQNVRVIRINFSCCSVYMTLRISMILYKTFILGVGGLNLNCCLVIIQLLSFFMLVVSRFILSLCFVFFMCMFFSLFCLYLSLCLCLLLCYAVNKYLYNSIFTIWACGDKQKHCRMLEISQLSADAATTLQRRLVFHWLRIPSRWNSQ